MRTRAQQPIDDLGQALGGLGPRAGLEGLADRRDVHRPLSLSDVAEHIAQEVHAARSQGTPRT